MDDFLQFVFEEALSVLLLAPLGYLYLKVRYRNQTRVQQALEKKYEHSYANIEFSLKAVAALGVLLVIGLMTAPLLHVLRS